MTEKFKIKSNIASFFQPSWCKSAIWITLTLISLVVIASNEPTTRFSWLEQRGFPIYSLELNRSYHLPTTIEGISYWGLCVDSAFWYVIASTLFLINNHKFEIVESLRPRVASAKLIIQGGVLSLSNAFLGSIVFAILGSITIFTVAIWENKYQHGLLDYPLVDIVAVVAVTGLYSFFLSLLPAFIGGGIFFYELSRKMEKDSFSKTSALKFGTLLGLLAGVWLSFVVFTIDNIISKISNGGYFDQVDHPLFVFSIFMVEAMIIGSITGWRTSMQFMDRLSRAIHN
jgi:hypothetical protein